MEAFIKNHQFNIIRREMTQISKLLKYNSDPLIVDAVKDRTQETIEGLFTELSGEALDSLQMRHLMDEGEVTSYLIDLETYAIGMGPVSDGQINKLFRKEKKLKLPHPGLRALRHTYLGWQDEGKKKLYIVYESAGKLMGMACQINSTSTKNTTMCALCGHMSDGSDVVSTTVKCKTKNPEDYHAIGFNVCSDSRACNSRITEPGKLENLLVKASGATR